MILYISWLGGYRLENREIILEIASLITLYRKGGNDRIFVYKIDRTIKNCFII